MFKYKSLQLREMLLVTERLGNPMGLASSLCSLQEGLLVASVAPIESSVEAILSLSPDI
jgi:hypothetical protein